MSVASPGVQLLFSRHQKEEREKDKMFFFQNVLPV
jgi:hypothetical protein